MNHKKWMNNLGLKILALFFSIFLWLAVVKTDDPVSDATFKNIEVQVTHTEVVNNQGKNYQVLNDTQIVNVKVTAKRSVLESLTSEDIVAEADLRNMELQSLVPIQIQIPGYEGKYEAEAVPNNLQIKLNSVKQKVFPLTVSATGTPQDGCVIGNMTADPAKVTLDGAEDIIESIDKAVARVDVSGLSESGTVAAQLILYDAQQNVIDQSGIGNKLGDEGIQVEVEVLRTKDVKLNFSVSGTPKEGYLFTDLTTEPQSIQVCGTKEALKGIEELDIPEEEVDIDGATGKMELTVDISPYLPEGISLVDPNASKVAVTVQIEEEGGKTVNFPAGSIRVNNVADDLKVSFESGADVEMKFTGTQEALEVLDISNAVSIDLKSFTQPGEYDVNVDVELPEGVTLVKQPTIHVILEKKEEDSVNTDDKKEDNSKTDDKKEDTTQESKDEEDTAK